MKACIRFSADATICMKQDEDGELHAPTQEDLDNLPVGPDLTDEEIQLLDC